MRSIDHYQVEDRVPLRLRHARVCGVRSLLKVEEGARAGRRRLWPNEDHQSDPLSPRATPPSRIVGCLLSRQETSTSCARDRGKSGGRHLDLIGGQAEPSRCKSPSSCFSRATTLSPLNPARADTVACSTNCSCAVLDVDLHLASRLRRKPRDARQRPSPLYAPSVLSTESGRKTICPRSSWTNPAAYGTVCGLEKPDPLQCGSGKRKFDHGGLATLRRKRNAVRGPPSDPNSSRQGLGIAICGFWRPEEWHLATACP